MRGITDVTLVQELGQPSLTIKIDRAKIARYGLNVDNINALITTAIGGDVATQVVQGEKEFDLVVRLQQQYRDNPDEIGNIPVATPAGQQIPLKDLADISVTNGASFIYREANSRYIGVQFSVEGRDLASAVGDAIAQVRQKVHLPAGYHADWGGEYSEYTASRGQLYVILPLTIFLIFPAAFRALQQFQISRSSPWRACCCPRRWAESWRCFSPARPFPYHRGWDFWPCSGSRCRPRWSIFPMSMSCAWKARPRPAAIREGAILRLRPIMMTALVAALGLLPAAIATGVGTDSQKPFALVIVSGLFTRLLISVFLMPVLYQLVARPDDRLEV